MEKAYIYTRVSTEMQIDGYSLEAQEAEIKEYAKKNDIVIVGSYTDEGKSGKNIEDREGFQSMLEDIKSGKDGVNYVIAFKLSRIGRNTADVINANQILKDYGVYLICIKDNINTKEAASTVFISVMASMAEMERENIITQTMAGRKQKARNGLWNGGQAPYGYRLEDGILYIDETEASTVRIIFDKYINTNLGYVGVSKYLNEMGIVKITRGNTKLNYWTDDAVLNILKNPVYAGKIAYGRTKTEQVKGKRNSYRRVETKEFDVWDGKHEAIVSMEDFARAQEKIKQCAVKVMRKHDLDHEFLLSTLVKCPECGRGMYGNLNRHLNQFDKNGNPYPTHFYYKCDYSKKRRNYSCSYKKQINAKLIEDAVSAAVLSLMEDSYSVENIRKQLNKAVDSNTLREKLEAAKATLAKLNKKKERYNREIGDLDEEDKYYLSKLEDLRKQINKIYEDIDKASSAVYKCETELASAVLNETSVEDVIKMMKSISKHFYEATDQDKKILLHSLIDSVEIYKEPDEAGQIVKAIHYKFPVYAGDELDSGKSWDEADTVESVCLLSNRKADAKIRIDVDLEDYYAIKDAKKSQN